MCKALPMAYPIVYGLFVFILLFLKENAVNESTDKINFQSQYNQLLFQSCLLSDEVEISESLLNRSIYIN